MVLLIEDEMIDKNSGGTMKYRIVLLVIAYSILLSAQDLWQATNGPFGGYILTTVVSPNGQIVTGTTNGVYTSSDNGNTWVNISNGISNGYANAVAVSAEGYIFAGINSNGVYRTANNGKDWEKLSNGIATGDMVYCLAAKAGGLVFAGTYYNGFFRSTNNGNNWELLNIPFNISSITSISISASGDLYLGVHGSGLLKSTDNGNNWQMMLSESSSSISSFFTVVLNSQGHIFAGTDRQVWRSTDNGASWMQLNLWLSSSDILSIYIRPDGTILAGTVSNGIKCSTDNGNNWSSINNGLTGTYTRAINSLSNGNILAGTFGEGMFISADGNTWTKSNSGLVNTRIAAIAINTDGNVFAASSESGVFRSYDSGNNWTQLVSGLDVSRYNAIIISQKSYVILGGFANGVYRSTDTGSTWTKINNDGLWTLNSLALSPNGTIFASTGYGVMRSLDDGDTWSTALNLSNTYSVTTGANGKVFAANMDGAVCRSTDNGAIWNSSFIGMTTAVSALAVDKSGNVFAGTNAGVFRSTNGGVNWTQINSGLVSTNVQSIAVNARGIVFVSTGSGVYYLSTADGNWTPVVSGLQNTFVTSLAFNPDGYLFAGTNGSGVYKTTTTKTAVKDLANSKNSYSLEQNYPNPFNPSTVISYSLPSSGKVSLKVFDMLGKEISTLVNEEKHAGQYEVKFDGANLPSGVYLCVLRCGSLVMSNRMMLLK